MTRKGASHGRKRGFVGFSGLFEGVLRDLVDPYRPELHYMRGPGPRCGRKAVKKVGMALAVVS